MGCIIELKRLYKKPTYTIGKMYINGEYFCDTLEDVVRDKNNDGDLLDAGEQKVYGKTAIPKGEYKVIVSLSSRFKRRLPLLLNVPHFEGVRIHRGNTPENTSGCILVGVNNVVGRVTNSTAYELRLTDLLERAQANGESITIKIE